MSCIFISYRRSDAASEAGRIYDYLENRLGENSIFKDVDNISAGEDFRLRLHEAMARCCVLLAVIGKNWLQVKDSGGQRRLNNPADWVRLEIETALKRGVRVIPVLLDGVEMPTADMLPETLVPLAYRNAARVRHDPDFRRDMERLVGVIEQYMSGGGSAKVKPSGSITPNRTNPNRTNPNKTNPNRTKQLLPDAIDSLGQQLNRRQVLKWLGYSGSGLGLALLGQAVWQNWPQPEPSEAWPLAPPRRKVLNRWDVTSVSFEVITVNETGDVVSKAEKQSNVYEAKIKDVRFQLLPVPAGRFTMGMPFDPDFNSETFADRPQREVSVSSFLMGRYPVTQAQWKVIAALPKVNRDLKASPAAFVGDDFPVEQVDWDEATEFCLRLTRRSGRKYRLPSEAEWEYACRAGTTTYFHVGDKLTSDLANFEADKADSFGLKGMVRGKTTRVGSFPANNFGLHDMHGNVGEWCLDPWHLSYEGAPADSNPWIEGGDLSKRAIRGGSWEEPAFACSSARRHRLDKNEGLATTGFRVVCEMP